MKNQGGLAFVILMSISLLTGCLNTVWTSATLVYDRHHIYKKMTDYQLGAQANHALYDDQVFKQKGCVIDLAVFNGDILLAGHVPSIAYRQEAVDRISALHGYRRIINQLKINSNPANTVEDSWITAKIRSQIVADAAIDPSAFKVITADRIVYLMGDVRPKEAERVIQIARTTKGVRCVVKLLKYYNLSHYAEKDT